MSIGNALKKFLFDRKNSLLENIMLCFAITLASAFFQYDSYYFYMDFMRVLASVMLLVSWLWCGFLSGKDKKWGFLVFASAYWLVPYLYILCYRSTDTINNYNAVLKMIYKFADMLFDRPLKTIADFTNCDVYIWILSLAILTFTAYFVGINLGSISDDKKRSENAEDDENEDEDEDEYEENFGFDDASYYDED